jgi:uncharacterized protein (DUF736 family)
LTSGQSYDLTVNVSDAAGNAAPTNTATSFTVDTVAPVAPSMALDDTGSNTSDGLTNDNTVTVSGVEAGATWQYSTDNGASWSAAQAAAVTSFTLADAAYAEGQIQVRQTDAAGNTGAAGSLGARTVDTAAPAAPSMALDDTGSNTSDGLSKDNTVAVTGVEAGATWQYSTDSGATWSAAQAAAVTSFTLADGAYADGQIQVRQIDAAGNTGAAGSLGARTVDTAAPAAPSMALDDTGSNTSDGLSKDNTVAVTGVEAGATWQYSTDSGTTWSLARAAAVTSFTLADGAYEGGQIQVRQTDAAGNTGAAGSLSGTWTIDTSAPAAPSMALDDTGSNTSDGVTNDNTVTVSGVEAGAAWEYSTNGGSDWTAGSGGSFTLADADYAANQIRVRQTDAAGNTGAADSLGAWTIDTSAPTVPTNVTVSPQGGTVVANTLNATNTHVDFAATITDGEATGGKAEFYVNGVLVATDNSIAAGDTSVTATTSDGDPTTAEVQAAIASGGVVSVKLYDAAGNVVSADGPTLVRDLEPPSRPSAPTQYLDDVGAILSSSSTARVTDDARPGLLVGTNLGDTPSLYVDGQRVAATYDPAAGTLTPDAPLAEGTRSLSYTLTDAAGNESVRSAALTLALDLTAPVLDLDSSAASQNYSQNITTTSQYHSLDHANGPATVVDAGLIREVKISFSGLLDGNSERFVLGDESNNQAFAASGAGAPSGTWTLNGTQWKWRYQDDAFVFNTGTPQGVAATQDLIRALGWQNDAAVITPGLRTISVSVTDEAGNVSNVATSQFNAVAPLGAADAAASVLPLATDSQMDLGFDATEDGPAVEQGSVTVTGSEADEHIVGSAGDDVLIGGGGRDTFEGLAGDDVVVLSPEDAAALMAPPDTQAPSTASGGEGFDTLQLLGGASFDLSAITDLAQQGDGTARIDGFEHIDMATDTAANGLSLGLDDVLALGVSNAFNSVDWQNLSGEALAATTEARQLMVSGDAADQLQLEGDWADVGTVTDGVSTYHVFESGASAQILIHEAMVEAGRVL